MDFSTIDLEKLYRLPVYKKPPTYRYQQSVGNSCLNDPPGYPTYFTRMVFTMHGSSPSRGVTMIITGPDGRDYVVRKAGEDAEYRDRIHSLWKPLPLDHERTRLWIGEMYRYFHRCYVDPSKGDGWEARFIFPVPDYMLKKFVDDPRFSEEWRVQAKAEVERFNAELIEYYRKLATPENHAAVRWIRKFYQEYQPEPDLIENPPECKGLWWETEAAPPSTPEECSRTERHGWVHPVNKTWCQWCGWREAK